MFVRYKETGDASTLQFKPDPSVFSRIRRTARYAQMRSDFFPRYVSWPRGKMPITDDRSRFAGELLGQVPPTDLLHFHWVSEFVDLPSSFEKIDVPIVWTLHDMNPFTGGCHYAFGCRRFEESCGLCPELDSSKKKDPSFRSWKRKRTAYQKKISQGHLHVVAPSDWLVHEAEQSTLLGDADIHCIPHGLNTGLFRPRDAKCERSKINISESQKVALFVAHSSTDPRKGFGILSEALSELHLDDVTLVSIGKNAPSVPDDLSHVHVGYINNDQRMSVLYSMANVFVIPSLQEAFGQTALEAMACGTPVIGFDTGGIPDMVRPGETGWLAETGSVRELRQAIETALENDAKREQMAGRCRQVVENEYTIEHQAQQYTTLYTSVLEDFYSD